jgi:hypothetical protein
LLYLRAFMMKHKLFIFLSLHLLYTQAQTPFSQKYTNVGRIGLNITNAGTIGKPDVSTNTNGNPSLEFPIGSGIEHLFESGLWIGAFVDGQPRVSSSSIEAVKGYSTGASGFEFTQTTGIDERSSLTSSSKYSSSAISHQDFYFQMTDKYTVIPGTSQAIQGHDFPLFADVKVESYAWNYSFADYFVILNYTITNNSSKNWDSVYLGMYSDMVVRNVNVTQETGTAFFNKGRCGFDSTNTAVYAFQVKGDDIDYTQSYVGLQLLGAEWRNRYFHPSQKDYFIKNGWSIPKINAQFWNYGGTNPPFAKANDDIERYSKLQTTMDSSTLFMPTGPYNSTNNWIQMISTGPFMSIAPGETVKFTVAFVCAKQLGGLSNNQTTDNESNRKELTNHLGWTKRTYLGEDANENGMLDSLEDLNGNKVLDRFILPSPPATPKTKIVTGNNKVDIYWDASAELSIDPLSKKKDFEGYKIYRTNPGDDLKLNLQDAKNLIAQYDKSGNNIGFNNNFKAVKLDQPKTFEGDSTSYTYHYEMTGLLNGWQYMFIITSFDEGDEQLGLDPLESSFSENDFRVYTGSAPSDYINKDIQPGVYPNPYKTSAAWDGNTSRTKKIMFYNLPKNAKVTIYTAAGDIVKTFEHHAETYLGEDTRWFDNYGGENTIMPGGEHAWDMLSESKTAISTGIYLYTILDIDSGKIKSGSLAIIK